MATKSKTFLAALDLVSSDPEKLKKTLNDKRMTIAEKKILEGYLMLRDSRFDDIIQSLSPLNIDDPFVEDQRLQVLAGAFNNKSECLKAWTYFEASHKHRALHKIEHGQFYFLIYYFSVALNLKKEKELHEIYNEILKCPKKSDKDALNFVFCQYQMSLVNKDLTLAQQLLQKLKSQFAQMSAMQIVNYYIYEFNLRLELNHLQEASETLEELKKFRKFRSSVDYKFMRSLLDHFKDGQSIYLYEQDFQDLPEMMFQVGVLKALEQKDRAAAQTQWTHLQKMSPAMYGDDFTYNGQTCIFSCCLKAQMNKTVAPILYSIDGEASKEDKVIQLLQNAEGGLPKAQVYKLIYGTEFEDKDDLNKLRTLMHSIRKNKAINIKSRKGCYYIAS